ncbi:MAG: hypothetical protein LIV24_09075 [Eubacterium sp.]|nr:hypothetical protein [Eubacterium sp.]
MSDKQNTFHNNVDSLFEGLNNFLTTKTVVGQPVPVGDSIMIPLSELSFGMGAGAFSNSSKDNGGGGVGAKMVPAAVLMVAKDGTTKLISMKSQDAVSKIIDMAPDIVTKIKEAVGGKDAAAAAGNSETPAE